MMLPPQMLLGRFTKQKQQTEQRIKEQIINRPPPPSFPCRAQDYFRKCESQILRELSPYKNLVVATGGGAVIKPENWGYMHLGIVCWLRGDVELLAGRVAADGVEKRPLLYADGTTPDNVLAVSARGRRAGRGEGGGSQHACGRGRTLSVRCSHRGPSDTHSHDACVDLHGCSSAGRGA